MIQQIHITFAKCYERYVKTVNLGLGAVQKRINLVDLEKEDAT